MAHDHPLLDRHQRQREVAIGAQCIDDRRLGTIGVGMAGERVPENRRLVARPFGTDRPVGYSQCPAESRLVAR